MARGPTLWAFRSNARYYHHFHSSMRCCCHFEDLGQADFSLLWTRRLANVHRRRMF